MSTGATEVRILAEDRGGPGWSVYDGQEWFAHSSTLAGALHYASDLLHGPGVGPRGSVWNLMRAIEETGYNPQPKYSGADLSGEDDAPLEHDEGRA